MSVRGRIRNRKLASQIRDFSGLRFNTITPTDIDGFLEFSDKIFIFIETKYKNTPIVYGQKLALTRLVDICWKGNKFALLIIASHETEEGEDIDYANCQVREIRFEGKWHEIKNLTIKICIDRFLAKYFPEKKFK